MRTTVAHRDADPDGALILGDGYLAAFLMPYLAPAPVLAISRSGRGADATSAASCKREAADLFETATAQTWRARARELCGEKCTVYVLLPPSALGGRDVDEALPPLVEAVAKLAPRHLILASSSGVYGGSAGEIITTDGAVVSDSPRARRLLAIEQAWAALDCPVSVVRLAGLYGPGRLIGWGQIEAGDALPGAADDWLNLIHSDDAARALRTLAGMASPPELLLLSDGRPYRRGDYYRAVAAAGKRPPPRFDTTRARRGASRRLDPWASWAALALSPAYPDAREAVAGLLEGREPTRE